MSEHFAEVVRDLGGGQLVQQVSRGAEEHAASGGARFQTEANGQVGLANVGSANEQDVGSLIEAGQAGQLAHACGGEARLETEVELLKRTQHRKACASNARVDRAVGFIGEFQFK